MLGPISGIRREADPRVGTFPHERFERWRIRIGDPSDEAWLTVPPETGKLLTKVFAEGLGAEAFLSIEAQSVTPRGSADG